MKLADTYGLGPYAERLRGSNPLSGTQKCFVSTSLVKKNLHLFTMIDEAQSDWEESYESYVIGIMQARLFQAEVHNEEYCVLPPFWQVFTLDIIIATGWDYQVALGSEGDVNPDGTNREMRLINPHYEE